MFDDINLVRLLSSSKPNDIAQKLTDQQIRSILPGLIWLGFQQCPKNHRLNISAEILQIVSRFHELDSILDLFEIDFHSLNLEIKRLQRIKQKTIGTGQQNSHVGLNHEILGFEQASARDRCRIVGQILFDDIDKDLQLISNLLDEPNHVRIVGDVLCILVLHLSHTFKFDILISNLLHSKYAYEYLIRLILNIPTLKLTLIELIIRCSQNDDIRRHLLRTFIQLYPIYKLRLLRLCYQRNTLLLLILELLDQSTQNFLLLILSNSKQRLWFKKYQTNELIHNLLKKLFQLYHQKQCSEHFIFKITVILHIHCNIKFSSDEIQQLLQLLISSPRMNLTLGLCFLFIIPSLVESNEQKILDWILPTISTLETDEKLLMIGLFCMTNYNEPLNALISSTLDYPCRIDPGLFHHFRLLLIQRVFTNDLLVQRFSTIQITSNLNSNLTSKHLPAYFICYLLSKGLCNHHHVEMNSWIWSQILQCTVPIHSIILTLINEFVQTIVDPRYVWHLSPIDTNIIRDYLNSTLNNQISRKLLILFYLLTLIDQAQGEEKFQYQQLMNILLEYFPLPHLVEQLTNKNYDSIAPQLGKLMMEQLPQVFLADHALYLENDSKLICLHHENSMKRSLDRLKSILINGISRKQADQWRRRWFRIYTLRGQLLTLKTAQILLNNSQLTYDNLCADPHCLLRFSFELYHYPSIIQIILFIMREVLIASRHRLETISKSKQDIAVIQDVKSKQIQETLIHAQEALVIQILLDILHQYKQSACLPAYRELQGVICSFIHQLFITNPVLAKLVHFQGYPSNQIKPLIYSVPSMHICLDFIPQMLANNELETQIFAFELLTDLSSFYPIRTALLVVKLALQVYATLLRVLSTDDRLRFFSRTYKFLTHMSSIFPPLTQNSIYILQQAIRACSLSPSNLPQLKWTSDSLNRPRRIEI